MLIDSHCHLDFPELAADRAGVLTRAKAAGIDGMVTISTRVKRFDEIKAIADKVVAAAGKLGATLRG